MSDYTVSYSGILPDYEKDGLKEFKIHITGLYGTDGYYNQLCKSYFEELEISDKQISEIYSTGDVTPGDFGALNGKLRFLPAEKRTAEYITEELCKIVRGKKRSYENKKIGFGL